MTPVSEHIIPIEPVAIDLGCEHCHQPLEAYWVRTIHGLHAGYVYRHQNGHETCTRTYRARPYDGYQADAMVRGAKASALDGGEQR